MHNGNTLWRDTSQIGDVATCPAEFTQTGLGECHSPPPPPFLLSLYLKCALK